MTGPDGFLSELVEAVLERGLARNTGAARGRPDRCAGRRDGAGTFTPVMLPRNARRLGGLSDVVISLYAGGMSVWIESIDIQLQTPPAIRRGGSWLPRIG